MELFEVGDVPDDNLLYAARVGNEKMARRALAAGADVNCFSGSPVYWACFNRNDGMLKLLMTYRHKPPRRRAQLVPDSADSTPSTAGKSWEPPPPPNVELVQAWGSRAVHAAVSSGNVRMKRDDPACIQLLVEVGAADVVCRDAEGSTPLMAAAYWGNVAIVKYLLSLPTVANAEHLALTAGDPPRTAVEWADDMGHDEVVEALRAAVQAHTPAPDAGAGSGEGGGGEREDGDDSSDGTGDGDGGGSPS